MHIGAALAVARPDRLAGYTAGERDVIAYCEEQAGRRLTAREIAFQIACAGSQPGIDGETFPTLLIGL